jgi:hypothetical protein
MRRSGSLLPCAKFLDAVQQTFYCGTTTIGLGHQRDKRTTDFGNRALRYWRNFWTSDTSLRPKTMLLVIVYVEGH